ncbi:MAG: efflux RND transporter periplasmic adaptor subunit [Candidatus Pacebacteria bacterium]|nr:efflux RND transporter periplasmic adaptor subunit [Candidatus Paceibacterota bacterium]
MKIFHKIKNYVVSHKIISVVILIAVIFGGYQVYKSKTGTSGEVRYVTAVVVKGAVISSVTGSGQVSASNQVDVKPKTSGDVIYVGVKSGQEVSRGGLIAQLDTTDAQKAIRNAEIDLETAKLNLDKLLGSENAAIPKNKQEAEDDLKAAYDSGFNAVSNVFLDLPSIMTTLQGMYFDKTISANIWNVDYFEVAAQDFDLRIADFHDDAIAKYQDARKRYDVNFQSYKSVSRFSDMDTLNSLINETYDTTRAISDAIRSMSNLIQFYEDILSKKFIPANAAANTYLTTLGGYISKTNSHLSSLTSIQSSIKTSKEAVSNADFDVRSQKIIYNQKEEALAEAKTNLSYCYIRAPFDGAIAVLDVKKGDSVGSGTAVATLITKQKIAEISLNEVDIAKIKVGQKSNLTFDAIDGLNVTGEVIEVDSLGTVSQGVVSYAVKIGFDIQDDRVKSGMSVNVSIATDVKQDVLVVANSAVKTQGDIKYVEMFEQPLVESNGTQGTVSAIAPRQQQVEVGISNDTLTEIISGLKEGDQIVSRTINSAAKTAIPAAAPSLFGGGGGNVKIQR